MLLKIFLFFSNLNYSSFIQKVTIAGESAGAMSVMALYLSKAAEGLFHGAIAQSGVINMPMMYENELPINHLR